MPDLAICYLPIADLAPYPKNARTHSPEQIAQIAASIREYGFANPILTDDHNSVIAGHGRLLAAASLGMEQVPTIALHGLTAAQKRALRIADNKLALNAGWSDELLRAELIDLQFDGFDLGLTGFSGLELTELLTPRTDGLTDPDEVPEAPAESVSRTGDVWLLGRHRLACGDATSEADVALALGGVRPHLMVTDPPYGVSYDAEWRNEYQKAIGQQPTYKRSIGKVGNDDQADWSEAWSLFAGDVAYVWHGERQLVSMARQMEAVGLETRNLIVWAKAAHTFGRGHYHNQHETCWYVVRRSGTGHWSGSRSQTTLWQIDKHRNNDTGHSTQKPVECMKRPIENNSSPGQAVYDPFVGSGTTIIAAEMTGRVCHAIEISPQYVDVAIQRWQNFTGQQATLERTGQTYAERAEEMQMQGADTSSAL
ncbi:MAG TPA: DNA methyltransferase [Pseudolysinimonas sp.]|jgi:DNA modification methylase